MKRHLVFIVVIIGLNGGVYVEPAIGESNIKMPNVSGQFYSADSQELSSQIDQYLKQAQVKQFKEFVNVIISPHAGYMYSGSVAAHSFKSVSQLKYHTIIILAPSHFYSFDGVSVWAQGGFKTPLGIAQVDEALAQNLLDVKQKINFDKKAFDREHSLEVEIPFIQTIFAEAKIVPVILGQAKYSTLQSFANLLHKSIGNRKDVLIVVSTDLSHYHQYDKAVSLDKSAIDAIVNLDASRIYKEVALRKMEMCGFIPVVTGLLYAKLAGLNQVDVLNYANSGDVTSNKSRVVGYGSLAIYENKDSDVDALNNQHKKQLIDIARRTIEKYVKGEAIDSIDLSKFDNRLKREEGAFVTIHKQGKLRGCIGNIIGRGPLCHLVPKMAIAAASEDPRFPKVTPEELNDIDVEVSVLSKPKVVVNADEIELGIHGVIISQGPKHSGVFLPQVATETKWSKDRFLSELCSQKAGLPKDCWKDPKTRIEVFTAQVFDEHDVK